MNAINASHSSPVAWYKRPRPASAPIGFPARLSESLELLREASLHSPCVFAHSLSAEDMVIFHLIVEHSLPIRSFALDTGKLPEATLELWSRAEAIYSTRIERIIPVQASISALAAMNADSALYESKSVRLRCCELRKTEPLRALLAGKQAWVTGLRRAQSVGRATVNASEFDHGFQLQKFNPLLNWADEDVWYFTDKHKVPHSPLYEKGYASIGCDPCTRPIRENEHPRAGRWWWEQTDPNAIKSECGIHVATNDNSQDTK